MFKRVVLRPWTLPMMSVLSLALKLFLFPFTITFNIIQPLWQRIYQLGSSWYNTGSARRFHLAADPASVADRWVRQLEEETGAYRAGRVDLSAVATGAEAGPGPSTLSKRSEALRTATGKSLPDFHIGSYDSVLKRAEKEARPLCVIVLSEEHDDTPEFKRTTLVNPEFNKLLRENNFLVWGGDISSYEGYQTSQKLGATTYPFVAFVALQPRLSRNTSSSPALTVLSRHQGPSTAEFTTPTSPQALCDHLTEQLLPRVKPYLERLQNAERERTRQRRIMEEQQQAFELSALRDRERLEAKIAAERKAREEKEAADRAVREAEERRIAEEDRKKRIEATRIHYYRYARRCLVRPEPPNTAQDSFRLGFRLPDGRRVIRSFHGDDNITSLYNFASTLLVPVDLKTETDPDEPPEEYCSGESGLSADLWSFDLVLAYPRKEVKWTAHTPLSAVDGLSGGGQLVVELKRTVPQRQNGGNGRRSEDGDGDSSDYDTEEE